MNIDYSQFYRGTTNIPSYGSGAYKKDTLVKYEFNTTDEHGNKVMDKMSREETLQAMKDIRSQYGDAVIVEFSGDGMAALVEGKKGSMVPEDKEAMEAKNAAFQKDIVQIDNSLSDLPAYSGMYGADKAVASALENCGKEEKGFVYDIIRQNFLVGSSGSMTEEERQANISLGMKKAEYAAQNFIPEESRAELADRISLFQFFQKPGPQCGRLFLVFFCYHNHHAVFKGSHRNLFFYPGDNLFYCRRFSRFRHVLITYKYKQEAYKQQNPSCITPDFPSSLFS